MGKREGRFQAAVELLQKGDFLREVFWELDFFKCGVLELAKKKPGSKCGIFVFFLLEMMCFLKGESAFEVSTKTRRGWVLNQ